MVEANVETDIGGQKIREHVHGGRWEAVKFACGRRDAYIPNFSEVEKKQPCGNSAEVKARAAKLQVAKDKLTAYVKKLDIDDYFKERVIDSVRFLG